MGLLDNFKSFARRVMRAVKGKISPKDEKRLLRLFARLRKKNKIIATALLSSLKSGGAKEEEIQRISVLLERADHRLMNDKEPFTKSEEKEIKDIFSRTKIPINVFYKMLYSLDELLVYEIDEAIMQSKRNIEIKSQPPKSFYKAKKDKEKVEEKTKDKVKQ